MQVALIVLVVLAVVQGITEFLPVSSSGHLVIAEALFGVGRGDSGIIFEIAVHVGTLCAVLAVYRRRVLSICGALGSLAASGLRISTPRREDAAYAGWILVASIPAAIVGVFLHDAVAAAFDSPALAAGLLVVTGCFLLLSRRRGSVGRLGWRTALAIGAAQAVAVFPGCSRSGWTITTAVLLGLGYSEAAEFSFVLSIPAILGALVLEIAKLDQAVTGAAALHLIAGAVIAFLSGWVALRLLIGVLAKGMLHRFAYYLIPVGSGLFLYFLLAR